jgi:hypothetical protein
MRRLVSARSNHPTVVGRSGSCREPSASTPTGATGALDAPNVIEIGGSPDVTLVESRSAFTAVGVDALVAGGCVITATRVTGTWLRIGRFDSATVHCAGAPVVAAATSTTTPATIIVSAAMRRNVIAGAAEPSSMRRPR